MAFRDKYGYFIFLGFHATYCCFCASFNGATVYRLEIIETPNYYPKSPLLL
jgi:hypothetical protein